MAEPKQNDVVKMEKNGLEHCRYTKIIVQKGRSSIDKHLHRPRPLVSRNILYSITAACCQKLLNLGQERHVQIFY